MTVKKFLKYIDDITANDVILYNIDGEKIGVFNILDKKQRRYKRFLKMKLLSPKETNGEFGIVSFSTFINEHGVALVNVEIAVAEMAD